VLLLDEPAASLDPGHAAAIEGIIREFHRQDGTTIVLATHNLGQARRLSERVGLLAAGRLVELAETEAFFDRPREALTAAYLRGDLLTEKSARP
jgi:tungstate transport system ATP-binding protein